MRHILHDEIRPLFFPKLDALLDERVLMGNGVASIEGLRYSLFSERSLDLLFLTLLIL